MKIIRCSEIGTYLYCKRAWWYQDQGVPSQSQDEMAAGSEFHYQHGRRVLAADVMRLAGLALLLAAGILFVVAFISNWMG